MNDETMRRLYAAVVARRTPPGRETCASPEALQRVAELAGSEEERLAVLDHVGECAACQRDLEFFRRAQPAPDRSRRYVLAGLAAAAIILLTTTLLWRRTASPDELRGGTEELLPVAPLGGISGAPISFTWRSMPDALGYTVELFDSHDIRLLNLPARDTTLALPDSVRLVAGAPYTWRVHALLRSGEKVDSRFASFTLHTP